MKVIIAGSRSFDDYDLLSSFVKKVIDVHLVSGIISGGAKGADKLGERFATDNNITIHTIIPDWKKYGKRAGILRNKDMGDLGDLLVAFWDGESKGTKHMIDYMNSLYKPTYIYHFFPSHIKDI